MTILLDFIILATFSYLVGTSWLWGVRYQSKEIRQVAAVGTALVVLMVIATIHDINVHY